MMESSTPFEAMKARAQFILCRFVSRGNGKTDKLPIDHRTLQVFEKGANWQQDPAAWTTFANASFLAAQLGPDYGVGFFFTKPDPFFFLDIDNCLIDGAWSSTANDLMSRLSGAAIEVSQSGTGLHIFGAYRGAPPKHACKNIPLGLELYTSGRFVALTGKGAVGDASVDCTASLASVVALYFSPAETTSENSEEWTVEPVPECTGPEDDEELIRKACASHSAASAFGGGSCSFLQLWEADEEALSAVYPDQGGRAYDASSADAALCLSLAFWTGKNCARIDRLLRRSSLYRDKWEDRPDYRERTILGAVRLCSKVYTAGGKSVEPAGPVDSVTYRKGYQFLAPNMQVEHFAGCVYMLDRHRVFTPDGDQLNAERFNAIFGGYVFQLESNGSGKTTRKAWEAFTESQVISYPYAHGPCFRPELPTGQIVTEGGRRLVNVYVAAFGERIAGDISQFLEHVKRLLPNENDREIFLSYLAACVQRPGVKFQWCVVLQGSEGNGKTVFYHMLAYALGERYAHLPNAAEITNPFNAWLEQKLIIGIEELHTGGRQEVADTLKPMITNRRTEIHGKGQDQRTGDNRANFIMFSNHKDAVLKTENDRRYCVFYTAQQELGDLERDGMNSTYFAGLYGWLDRGGYAHVADYLARREVSVDVMGRAPVTTSTAEAVRSSLGVAEQIIQEAIDLEEWGFRAGLVCTKTAGDLLRANGKRLSPQKVASALANLGYIRHPALAGSDGKVSVDNSKRRLYVKRGSLAANLTTAKAVADAWKRAQGGEVPSGGAFQASSVFSEPSNS